MSSFSNGSGVIQLFKKDLYRVLLLLLLILISTKTNASFKHAQAGKRKTRRWTRLVPAKEVEWQLLEWLETSGARTLRPRIVQWPRRSKIDGSGQQAPLLVLSCWKKYSHYSRLWLILLTSNAYLFQKTWSYLYIFILHGFCHSTLNQIVITPITRSVER